MLPTNTDTIQRAIEMSQKKWKKTGIGLVLLFSSCQLTQTLPSTHPNQQNPLPSSTVRPTEGSAGIKTPTPISSPLLSSLTSQELDLLKNSKLLNGYNHLAFELLHFFSKDLPKDKNLIFSPLAIASLLTVFYYQSTGTERQTLGKILQIEGMSNAQVQQEFDLLRRYLKSLTLFLIEDRYDGKAELLTSLWLNQNSSLALPGQELQSVFNASLFHLPFQPETEKQMNQWIQTHTQGQINQMVAEKSLSASQNLYLLNALSFSSSLAFTFHKELTQNTDFINAMNKPVSFPFMNMNVTIQPGRFNDHSKNTFYGETLDAKALGLFFRNGLRLMLVLPQAKPTLDWAQILGYGEWYTLKNSLREHSVKDVSVPRWKQKQTHSLLPLLQSWGLGQDKNNPLLKPDQALHTVNLELSEDGIDGTEFGAFQNLGPLPNTLSFSVNRPFFYTLHDTQMNFILYMGIINDPTQP